MKKLKTFEKLSKKMETLSENAKGQLKGGFVVLSSDNLTTNLKNSNGTCTNNCKCRKQKT